MEETLSNPENNNIEKIKVTYLDIITTKNTAIPYYEIKYKVKGENTYRVGYSSYDLNIVLGYKEKYFEIVSDDDINNNIKEN